MDKKVSWNTSAIESNTEEIVLLFMLKEHANQLLISIQCTNSQLYLMPILNNKSPNSSINKVLNLMLFSWTQTMLLDQFQQTPLILSFAGTVLYYLSQIAHSSIYGLMSGYTNFVCGHFAMRNGMVPLP